MKTGKQISGKPTHKHFRNKLNLIFGLFFLLIIFLNFESITNFDREKIRLQTNYLNPRAHLSLARAGLEIGDWQTAKLELENARKLALAAEIDGQFNADYREIREKIYLDETLRAQSLYWERLVKEQGGYRDGYLQLAVLYYRLNEGEKAQQAWEMAKKIDPNHPGVIGLERFLGKSK